MTQTAEIMPFRGTQQRPPANVNGTVPNRRANDKLRSRSYLTESEVEQLLKVAKAGRHGARDRLMVLMAFRHGYRVSELCDVRWTDIDFKAGSIYVRRLKGSRESTHYLEGDELRGLRARHKTAASPFVFTSERRGPMSAAGFRKQLSRWSVKAGIGFPVQPHMLRHATGYALANRGMDTRSIQAFLGHVSIQHTVRYTEISPERFRGIWAARR